MFNMKIHEEGRSFIAICLACVLVSFFISSLSVVFFIILTVAVVSFFRDPDRISPPIDNVILSPADGVILSIDHNVALPKEIISDKAIELENSKFTKVSIFLSVFNVHVNRNAVSGVVVDTYYNSGKFFNASLDKASEFNERQLILVRTDEDKYVCFVQIAGLIARRIVCNLSKGAKVRAGERFGIIRFGSRMDIYVPSDYVMKVYLGQTMIGGETIVATQA
ncbi:phosphatidylserine decarboxylase family protein [Candidatus Fokinia crypta]|uniref:Phosphatidylserine decarboxylase proenzyme n=1 Tax=Candidatus Fokinia crypta TaxID=1920990 RepID=A0ABZ0URK0_9RICK|nr:phosphatidylserine decarboxylase family protein [Candidatus Fokinia cryptica]WPX97876.1 Phosphatidylserine decarboxylase proenzyme [Candidatus Fokinia cryptica]